MSGDSLTRCQTDAAGHWQGTWSFAWMCQPPRSERPETRVTRKVRTARDASDVGWLSARDRTTAIAGPNRTSARLRAGPSLSARRGGYAPSPPPPSPAPRSTDVAARVPRRLAPSSHTEIASAPPKLKQTRSVIQPPPGARSPAPQDPPRSALPPSPSPGTRSTPAPSRSGTQATAPRASADRPGTASAARRPPA